MFSIKVILASVFSIITVFLFGIFTTTDIPVIKVGDEMKILFIGDSLTAERGGLTVFPQLLATQIPNDEPEISWGTYTTGNNTIGASFVNHGHGGWATEEYGGGGNGFLPTVINTEIAEDADITVIFLGVNDHAIDYGQVNPRVSLVDYEANLESMIDQLKAANTEMEIILITPPPIETVASSVEVADTNNTRLKTYVDVVLDVAITKSVRYIDLYTQLWAGSDNTEATYVTKYTLDGVHLNQVGQNELYNFVRGQILGALVGNPGLKYQGVSSQRMITNGNESSLRFFSQDGIKYLTLTSPSSVSASAIRIMTASGVRALSV